MGATAPGEAVEQFPDERSELGKKDMFRDYFFSENVPPKPAPPLCSAKKRRSPGRSLLSRSQ